LAGKACNGRWTLKVKDAAAMDTGTLASFSVRLVFAAPGATVPVKKAVKRAVKEAVKEEVKAVKQASPKKTATRSAAPKKAAPKKPAGRPAARSPQR
jgi:subtilisin-like proprotein convertase family protein